jgi:hypothetical protein
MHGVFFAAPKALRSLWRALQSKHGGRLHAEYVGEKHWYVGEKKPLRLLNTYVSRGVVGGRYGE